MILVRLSSRIAIGWVEVKMIMALPKWRSANVKKLMESIFLKDDSKLKALVAAHAMPNPRRAIITEIIAR